MHLFDTPEGFVFHYEHGKHIQSRRFFLPTKKGRYIVSVSAIFFPLQLHDSLRMPTPSSQFVIPHGGDVCSLFINKSLLNFFIMDIMGHGFAVHKIADRLISKIIEQRNNPHLVRAVGDYWKRESPSLEKSLEGEMQTAIQDAVNKGYSQDKIQALVGQVQHVYTAGFIAASQVVINMDERLILFENYGEPAIYFILLDQNHGNILSFKTFDQGSAALGYAEEYKQFKESIPEDVTHFKIVMFTDAFTDQTISVSDNQQIDVFLLQHIHIEALRKNVKDHIIGTHRSDIFAREKIIKDVLIHMASQPPEVIVNFFYTLFKQFNQKVQADDMTLLVADFELQ